MTNIKVEAKEHSNEKVKYSYNIPRQNFYIDLYIFIINIHIPYYTVKRFVV